LQKPELRIGKYHCTVAVNTLTKEMTLDPVPVSALYTTKYTVLPPNSVTNIELRTGMYDPAAFCNRVGFLTPNLVDIDLGTTFTAVNQGVASIFVVNNSNYPRTIPNHTHVASISSPKYTMCDDVVAMQPSVANMTKGLPGEWSEAITDFYDTETGHRVQGSEVESEVESAVLRDDSARDDRQDIEETHEEPTPAPPSSPNKPPPSPPFLPCTIACVREAEKRTSKYLHDSIVHDFYDSAPRQRQQLCEEHHPKSDTRSRNTITAHPHVESSSIFGEDPPIIEDGLLLNPATFCRSVYEPARVCALREVTSKEFIHFPETAKAEENPSLAARITYDQPTEDPKITHLRVTFRSKGYPCESVECSDLVPSTNNSKPPAANAVEDKIVNIKFGTKSTPADRISVLRLCAEFSDIFVRKPGPWEFSTLPPIAIDTGVNLPIRTPPRRFPFQRRDAMIAEVRKLLAKGIIEPSNSPWLSQCVLVPKSKAPLGPDGLPPIRLVQDYRQLNTLQKPIYGYSQHTVPLVSEILDSLRGHSVFSSLDFSMAYAQILLKEEDREKSCFASPIGNFQYIGCSFGLRNLPVLFQARMNRMLGGLQPSICHVFLDDILCKSVSVDQHILHLRAIFERIRSVRMVCNPEKCTFINSELTYLGYRVGEHGIKMCPKKVKVITELAPPTSKKALKSLLGMVGFYSRFIYSYSSLVSGLYRLLKKDQPFVWTEQHQRAFEALKKALSSDPILVYIDTHPSTELTLTVDASASHIGGVLHQKDSQGKEGVVCYLGRSLTDVERRTLLNREREALACCWCVVQCRVYLLGKFFTLETDNANNVRWVLNWNKGGKLQRFGILLQEYHFRLVWKSNTSPRMKVADYLSRAERDPSYVKPVASVSVNSRELPTIQELRDLQASDPLYCRVIRKLKGNPENSRDVSELLAYGGMFRISRSGLLVHVHKNGSERVVAPPKARYRIFLHFHHMLAHFSRDKMYEEISRRFFWRGMARDIEDFVKACVLCQENKPHSATKAGKLQLFPCTRPWQVVHIDILGPFTRTKHGYRYCLTQIDRFSRFLILSKLRTMQADEVARVFWTDTCLKFGFPEAICHDKGSYFTSGLWRALCSKFWHIKQYETTSYHPQTNARAERVHRAIGAQLRILTDPKNRNDFDQYLDAIAFAHNITVCRTTGHQPFFLQFGRQVRVPSDWIYTNEPIEDPQLDKYALRLPQILREAHRAAARVQNTMEQKQKAHYDKTHFDVEFSVGDLVNLYTPVYKEGISHKLQPVITGPYRIERKKSPVTYEVSPGVKGGATQVIHVQRLRPRFTISNDANAANSDDPPKPSTTKDRTPPLNNPSKYEPHSKSKGDDTLRSSSMFPNETEKQSIVPLILSQRIGPDGREFLLKLDADQVWVSASKLPPRLVRAFESSARRRRAELRLRA